MQTFPLTHFAFVPKQDKLLRAVRTSKIQQSGVQPTTTSHKWSYASAFLYSLTLITTIGGCSVFFPFPTSANIYNKHRSKYARADENSTIPASTFPTADTLYTCPAHVDAYLGQLIADANAKRMTSAVRTRTHNPRSGSILFRQLCVASAPGIIILMVLLVRLCDDGGMFGLVLCARTIHVDGSA